MQLVLLIDFFSLRRYSYRVSSFPAKAYTYLRCAEYGLLWYRPSHVDLAIPVYIFIRIHVIPSAILIDEKSFTKSYSYHHV